MFLKTFVLTLATAAVCATASADVVYDNLTPNPLFGLTSGSSVGQSFTTGGSLLALSSVVFSQTLGTMTNGYTPGETFSLYSDSMGPAGDAPGIVLTTFNLSNSTTANAGNFFLTTATPLLPAILTPNTRYWLVLNAPVGGEVNWNYADYDTANPTYYKFNAASGVTLPATNTAYFNDATGTTFLDYTDGPQVILINAVPEPSSVVLLTLAGAGACLWVRRARVAKLA